MYLELESGVRRLSIQLFKNRLTFATALVDVPTIQPVKQDSQNFKDLVLAPATRTLVESLVRNHAKDSITPSAKFSDQDDLVRGKGAWLTEVGVETIVVVLRLCRQRRDHTTPWRTRSWKNFDCRFVYRDIQDLDGEATRLIE